MIKKKTQQCRDMYPVWRNWKKIKCRVTRESHFSCDFVSPKLTLLSMYWLCMFSLDDSCAWCDCSFFFLSDRRKFAPSKLPKSYRNKTIFMAVGGLFVWLSAHSSAVNLQPWHLYKHQMGIFRCLLCCAFQCALTSEASHVLKIGFDSSVAMTASCCLTLVG